jgi:hypothetical protein
VKNASSGIVSQSRFFLISRVASLEPRARFARDSGSKNCSTSKLLCAAAQSQVVGARLAAGCEGDHVGELQGPAHGVAAVRPDNVRRTSSQFRPLMRAELP